MNFAKKKKGKKEEEKKASKTWKSYRAMIFPECRLVQRCFVSMECAELFDWKMREFPREFFFFFNPKKRREQQTEGFFEVQSFQGHPNSTWSHDCCRFISISRVSIGKFALMFVTGWNSQLVSSWIRVFIKMKAHFYCNISTKLKQATFELLTVFESSKNVPKTIKKRWIFFIKIMKNTTFVPLSDPTHQLRTVTHQEVPSLRVLDGSMKYNKLH